MEPDLPSVILPCGTIIYKVYSYQFEHDGQTIHTTFLHYGEYDRSGADHSFSSELRRSFTRMLLDQPRPRFANSWIPLPDHEYLNRLSENGFDYGTYNICRMREANRTLISVRTARDGPQLIYSPHIRRP